MSARMLRSTVRISVKNLRRGITTDPDSFRIFGQRKFICICICHMHTPETQRFVTIVQKFLLLESIICEYMDIIEKS